MNIERQQEFIDNLKTLSLHHLYMIKDWITIKADEYDREEKLRFIDIEIEGRERRERIANL